MTIGKTDSNERPFARWRRGAIGCGAIAAVVALLWLWWNHLANRRLDAAIAAIVARHEPIFAADFTPPPLADDENAATYINAAGAAISPSWSTSNSNGTFPEYPPFPPAWYQMNSAAIASDGKTLALARQARQFNRAVWVHQLASPVLVTLLRYLNTSRALANTLADAAMLAHVQGDDAEAIERMRDLLHEADMLDDNNPWLVGRLVSIGIDALANERLQVIAADNLHIAGARFPGPTNGSAHPVSRQVVVELIAQLLDDEREKNWQRQVFLGERMTKLDADQFMIKRMSVLRPMFKLDAVRMLDEDQMVLRAIEQTNWPAASAAIAPVGSHGYPVWSSGPATPSPTPPRFSRVVSNGLGSSMNRYLLTEFRVEADRHVVAAALAIDLYKCDHGNWPTTLAELGPDYLPQVPINPFSTSAEPLGYLVHFNMLAGGAERPLLFFDTASNPTPSSPPRYPCFGWQSGSPSREWRDLTVWTPPPTTEPNP